MTKNLLIETVMTPTPHSIRSDETVAAANTMMREHQFRHLVVKKGGKLVGLVSDRDLKLALLKPEGDKTQVEDYMETNVYVVQPKATLASVVFEMASRKYGCVVIEDAGQVVGIFTAVDALNVLGEFLSQ